MVDILAGLLLFVLSMVISIGAINIFIYELPDIIDKIREAKTSWNYLKEEWSNNDR